MKTTNTLLITLILIILFLSISFANCLSQQKTDLDIEKITKLFEQSHSTLYSGAGSYRHVIKYIKPHVIQEIPINIKPKNYVYHIEYKFLNNDIYWERYYDSEKKKPDRFCSYKDDFAKIITFNTDSNGLLTMLGYLSNKTDKIMIENPFYYTYVYFKNEYEKYSLKMYDAKISDITYNGENCVLITYQGSGHVPKIEGVDPRLYESQSSKKTVMKIIMSLEHYKPLKYESTYDGVMLEEIDIDYQKIDNFVFPVKIAHSNLSMQGDKISESEMIFSNDWKLNKLFVNESFDIDFPSGLKILDERIGKTFIKK